MKQNVNKIKKPGFFKKSFEINRKMKNEYIINLEKLINTITEFETNGQINTNIPFVCRDENKYFFEYENEAN